jgi:uncharacterized protein YkwD
VALALAPGTQLGCCSMIRRNRSHLIRLSLASAVCAAASVGAPAPVNAQTEFPAVRMVRLVNELRATRGLNMLQVDPVLQRTSDRWSATMAVNRGIFHNDNLRNDLDNNWSKVGENVGRGPSIDEIQVGFATSADHLKNLLDPRWDVIAIGVVNGPDGFIYVTQHFEDLRETRRQPTAAPKARAIRAVRRV